MIYALARTPINTGRKEVVPECRSSEQASLEESGSFARVPVRVDHWARSWPECGG